MGGSAAAEGKLRWRAPRPQDRQRGGYGRRRRLLRMEKKIIERDRLYGPFIFFPIM
jgi:hypothetical protein